MSINPSTREEFNAVIGYCKGLGVDVGCGTNRLSPEVLALDHYPHVAKPEEAGANDMVVDCRKLPFRDNVFDFVFSSHCIEDFKPEEIPAVFFDWLRVVKKGGYLILLLPDMETKRANGRTRYPRVEDSDGNPSHRCNVGKNFIRQLTENRKDVIICQEDTIDHERFFTVDIVLKKL